MAGSRRLGRQHAFVVLCSIDVSGDSSERALQKMWGSSVFSEPLDPDEKPLVQRAILDDEKDFASKLVLGTYSNLATIDSMISKVATNWTLARMSLVDRNIIRLGTFEIVYDLKTDVRIIINEAVELAKKFGEQSSRFVNGILDKIANEAGRAKSRGKKRHRRNKTKGLSTSSPKMDKKHSTSKSASDAHTSDSLNNSSNNENVPKSSKASKPAKPLIRRKPSRG